MAKHVLRLMSKTFQDIVLGICSFSMNNVDHMQIEIDDDVVLEEIDCMSSAPSGRRIERKVSYVLYLDSWHYPRHAIIAYHPGCPALPQDGDARMGDIQTAVEQRWSSLKSDDGAARRSTRQEAWQALGSIMAAAGVLSREFGRAEVEGARSVADEQNAEVSKSLADLVIASARFASRWPGKRIDLGSALVGRMAEKFRVTQRPSAAREALHPILEEVAKERVRQKLEWGSGDLNHPLVHPRSDASVEFYGMPEAKWAVEQKLTECENGRDDWMLILVAEVARFGREAISGRRDEARKFAVRIAAVASAIVESIDEEDADGRTEKRSPT